MRLLGGLHVLLWSLLVSATAPAQQAAQDGQPAPAGQAGDRSVLNAPIPYAPQPLQIDALPPEVRERVRAVAERPTLRSRGPLEMFNCDPKHYGWLLDHPDLGVRLWRMLGAKTMDIERVAEGRFLWQDGQGSRVQWDTVLRGTTQRVWFAEGNVRPGMLLPLVAVKAVMVDNFHEGLDSQGKPAVRHQMELYLQTDNVAVAMVARMLGASAPHVAEQYLGQIEMFYGAMAWYLNKHPRQAAMMFEELQRPPAPGRTGG
jgi:hypothetical protein